MQSIIMHLDMNSYFASVEQQDNLSWRGKPVGVCEHLGGIIIGASIEAKKWGITTGTPVWEARKLFPKIILTHTHPDRYRFYTKKMHQVVGDYTHLVEKYSIDEVFLDITKVCNIKGLRAKGLGLSEYYQIDPFKEAVSIAKIIKQRMKIEVGDWLTCSIGIAENKTLAKIGSDLKKPDGLTVIRPQDKHQLYQKLKLTDIPGIGKRQERNLNELGIKTLLDLKNYPKSHLVSRFGIVAGHHLHHLGQLESSWKPSVLQDEQIKSMGHMYTLPQEFREQKFFMPVLYKLCEMVGRRLRRKGLEGNLLHFFVYDDNYSSFGQSQKLGDFIFDSREIFIHAASIFEKINPAPMSLCSGHSGCGVKPKGNWQFKMIGLSLANLRAQSGQLSLFGHKERGAKLARALDALNDKYGEFTVIRAPVLAAGKVFRDSIGFGRMKEL